ncbi:HAD family hydrolase [Rarobacter incanus]|uniref:HAD superfamily hydrolase (TIGR01490 family) n=1 Tax=Rarobacter incanus TaxID=153494 RepID=A0A542SQP5_9MICO|nr:HAD-IB family hydrolase [Rarobacter incanus]TQK76943.1 HAD superfamily hydrolase (TIGR01490 family) [Rarobacter incanus]
MSPTTASTPVTAAFFDVDNTVIRGASSFHLARALLDRGFFRKRDLLRFAIHQARYLTFGENKKQIAQVRAEALEIMKGHLVAEVVAIGEEVYDEVLALRIYPGALKLINDHLARGHEVWLVSATPIEIGELIARRLGATGALGTIAEHKDGKYTGRLVGDMMHGEAKALGVEALAADRDISLGDSYAYGDSMNDLPLLCAVGHACAINPDPRLRRHAKTVGWPIRDFRSRRLVNRRTVKTASAAGALWAAIVTVRTILRRRGLRR